MFFRAVIDNQTQNSPIRKKESQLINNKQLIINEIRLSPTQIFLLEEVFLYTDLNL